ncbi:MAG: glycosyltransferase [Acidobacteriota bacterium]
MSKSEAETLVSVIVPCRNSEATIRLCLEALLNQVTSIPYDITVVDSSTDQTPSIVEREFPSVNLFHFEKRTFAGAARNVGIKATRSTYCLMIDSDCVAQPDLIEKALARHREDNYAGVGGSLANGTPDSFSGWIGYLIEFREFMPSTPLRLETGVPTANLTYRREALERYGYFDEDLWPAEDLLFNWKLCSAGERILFDPAIEVTHLNRTGWTNVLSYQVNLGRTSAMARRRGGLPGSILLKYPPLVLLMPFVRTLKALIWFAKHDQRTFLLFLLIWPIYLLAATFWSYGFLSERWNTKA